MLDEFKKFILRGNVMDLAIGIIIGAAFTAIVNSLVKDVIMPPIGLALGGLDFSNLMAVLKAGNPPPPYATPADAAAAGAVTINYGLFINSLISFLIIALVIFLLVKAINRLYKQKPAEVTEKACPYCSKNIPISASRCPYCTSQLSGGTASPAR